MRCKGGYSYYAGNSSLAYPPKRNSAPRTPLPLAYPKFAWPFEWPIQMKIARTASDALAALAPQFSRLRRSSFNPSRTTF